MRRSTSESIPDEWPATTQRPSEPAARQRTRPAATGEICPFFFISQRGFKKFALKWFFVKTAVAYYSERNQ